MKLELFWDRNGKARLRWVGANGEILLSGEAYQRPANARKTANLILRVCPSLIFVELPKPKRK